MILRKIPLSAEVALSVHSHTSADIASFPTQISKFENDANYLTQHRTDAEISAGIHLSNYELTGICIPISWLNNTKTLATINVEGTWKWIEDDIEKTSVTSNLQIDDGFIVSCDAKWNWKIDSDQQVAPSTCSGDFLTVLPAKEIWQYKSFNNITTNTTIQQTIMKEKFGMEVKNEKVVQAEGNDLKSNSIDVTFYKRLYFGYSKTKNPADVDISQLTSKFTSSKSYKWSNVTATGEQYVVYAYPYSFGKLTAINKGTWNDIESFTVNEIEIENSAKKKIKCYMYISINRGAFTDVELTFV